MFLQYTGETLRGKTQIHAHKNENAPYAAHFPIINESVWLVPGTQEND